MTSTIKHLAVIMDPIESVAAYKDTTIGMLWAAQREFKLDYLTLDDLWLDAGVAYGQAQSLRINDSTGQTEHQWYELDDPKEVKLGDYDVILMRKDPPFNLEYIYATYILERAEIQGAYVSNNPQALRDINEKAYTAWFPEYCPATLVTRDMQRMINFQKTHGRVVAKPLDGMGGKSIFVINPDDGNRQVIFETLTSNGRQFAMLQAYIPEIKDTGDQRIIVIDGEVIPYSLARIPSKGEHRGNLAAGGKGKGIKLSERAKEIAEGVGKVLKEKGVLFAGLDVIGDYLTEINITSPTGIRELDKQFGLDLGKRYIDALLQKIT